MRRPPLAALALAFPVLELVGMIWVGSQLGFLATILLLLLGVVLGSWLIQAAGRRSFRAMASSMRSGQPPQEDLAQTGWYVAAGVLLIVPGFLSDLAAVLVAVPVTRRLMARALHRFMPVTRVWVPPTTAAGDQAEPTVVRGDVL